MNPKYAFLKFNQKTQSLNNVGAPDLTAEDIAHAAGRVPNHKYLLARIVWLHDDSSLNSFFMVPTIDEATKLPEIYQMRHNTKDGVKGLILGAIRELAIPNHCSGCAGKGEVWKRGHTVEVECEKCMGTGIKKMSESRRAHNAGKDKAGFRRYWKKPYESVFKMLSEWENDVFREISKRGG